MKKGVFGIFFVLVLSVMLVLGNVQVFAGISPYQEIYFADEPDDYETEIGNEFHHDVLKFEGNLGGTFDGAWLEYDSFSFGAVGAVAIKVNYCNNSGRCAGDSQLEVWIDGKNTDDGGTKVGTVDLPATGSDWQTYVDTEVNLDTVVTGDHDIFMVLVGTTSTNTPFISNMMFFEFIKGEGEEPTEDPIETLTPTPTQASTQVPAETLDPTPTKAPIKAPTETPRKTAEAPVVSATQQIAENGLGAGTSVLFGITTVIFVIIAVVAVVVIVAVVSVILIIKKKKKKG